MSPSGPDSSPTTPAPEPRPLRPPARRRSRLSIPTRIFAAFAITLVGFAVVSVSSVLRHDRSARMLQLLHDGYLPLAMRLGEARSYQNVYRRHVESILEDSSERVWFQAARQVRPSTMRRLDYFLERAERLAERADDAPTLRPVREAVEAIGHGYESTDADYDVLLTALENGDRAEAQAVHDRLKAAELEIERQYREGYGKLVDRIDALASEASEQERQASVVLGVLAFLALLVGLSATFWSLRVLRPLPLLQERVGAIAEGDFDTPPLKVRGADELALLAQDFDHMVDALRARDAGLSELRRMQAQIVAGLRAAVVVLDGDDVVRSVNPAAARVLGLSREAEGHEFDTPAGLRDGIAEVRSGTPQVVLEAIEQPDPAGGATRQIDMLLTAFGDEPGAILLVAEDVTDALRTKERLLRTERLAAIGRMAAHVTHEVRNPLSSIGLNVDMLRDEILSMGANDAEAEAEATALLEAIQTEIDRLTGITEQYLRLARLPQPRFEVEDLGEIATALANFMARDFAASGVHLDLAIESGLPTVRLDENQIRQALLNLIRNAVDASPEGGRVRLGIERVGDGILVSVEDEGEGVPESERERIFDLFFTTKERGSGLGLPLTQQVVHAHGGTIRVTQGGAGGARFELVFPLKH